MVQLAVVNRDIAREECNNQTLRGCFSSASLMCATQGSIRQKAAVLNSWGRMLPYLGVVHLQQWSWFEKEWNPIILKMIFWKL